MTTNIERNEHLDESCRLVGFFLKHYAVMEQALDLAIGKLLGLQGGTIDIIGASIPVAKKVDVLLSAEKFLAAIPEKDREVFLEKTRKDIMRLNDDRVIVAHCPFEPSQGGGVTFRRVAVSSGRLKTTSVTRSVEEIESKCKLAVELAAALDRVVTEMQPYEPGFDFRDPRNAMYAALI